MALTVRNISNLLATVSFSDLGSSEAFISVVSFLLS